MTILFLYTGAISQVSLQEYGPTTVKPAETLELTCKVIGASLTDGSKVGAVYWARQRAGEGLIWLGGIWHAGSIHYAESMKGLLTITRDTNKGEVYCKLTQIKPEDTAVYYCARDPH